MEGLVLQVGEAVNLINQTLDAAYPVLVVEGEVSGFTVNRSNYVFFNLKDEEASLSCFTTVYQLKFPLEDGMKVRVVTQPKLTTWGKFSLTIREVQPLGEGSVKKAFELLQSRLQAEGLFDDSRKRVLPELPRRIGVVSSAQAAGFADFTKILEARWGGLNILLADVGVQGLHAPGEIVRAIEYFNAQAELVDVLVVIRGGGSLEDLAAFNHEDVVRTIAGSRIPTVVGVGHETDTTLSDLAADRRASTPSNAAEIVVPEKHDMLHRINRTSTDIEKYLIDQLNNVGVVIKDARIDVDQQVGRVLERAEDGIASRYSILKQLDPKVVLKRGYALVTKDQRVVAKYTDATIGEMINITLGEGSLEAKVTDAKI